MVLEMFTKRTVFDKTYCATMAQCKGIKLFLPRSTVVSITVFYKDRILGTLHQSSLCGE